MFAKIKQVAAAGAAVAGVGWVTFVSPAVANAQPLPIPQDNNITCPDIAGVQYVPDPDNSGAYYVCSDGLQQGHEVCPEATRLDMDTTPPSCPPKEGYGKP
jgi:hypothetical protein